jgi:hypothetical protein
MDSQTETMGSSLTGRKKGNPDRTALSKELDRRRTGRRTADGNTIGFELDWQKDSDGAALK